MQKTVIPSVPFDRCAAKSTPDNKPGTSVFDHCRNVGYVADALMQLLPAGLHGLLPIHTGLPVSVHDVGKVSPGFMLKYFSDTIATEFAPELVGQSGFMTSHAPISAAAIDRYLGERHPMTHPASIAAAAHHGSADLRYPPDAAETLGGLSWSEERQKLIAALTSCFGGHLNDSSHAHPSLLSGLTCVADWLGSSEECFPADQPPIKGDPRMTARHAVSWCGFEPSGIRQGLSFEDIFAFPPRSAQCQFIEQVSKPGVYVLEAPMGMGKTEAALYVTYRLMEAGYHHGFYFALPTRLTSDRIHERVSAFLETIATKSRVPRLAHGMAWLSEFARGGEHFSPGESWFNPMKRALLHPYAVGTVDQALMAVLNVKHGFVRLFGLAGKVVILDEVHSYDMYTGTLLDELVTRLRQIGCTVIILSATLTASRRCQLLSIEETAGGEEPYPLMTVVPHGEDPVGVPLAKPEEVSVNVRMADWDIHAVAEQAAAAARKGVCVVCIANTVAKAQAWYRAVQSECREQEFATGLLHARFPQARRAALEDEWMRTLGGDKEAKRPRGCVLVSTQILEQSVDIDADWMISELAPSDMLLQRMGRLWRHKRPVRPCPTPEFVVVTCDPSNCQDRDAVAEKLGKENCCVYAPYVLMRTHTVWKSRDRIRLPGDIRALVEATYADAGPGETGLMRQLHEHLDKASEKLRMRACSAKDSVMGIPTRSDTEERAPTRYNDRPMRTVLLLAHAEHIEGSDQKAHLRLLDDTECTADFYRPDFGVTRLLHVWTVNIAAYLLPENGSSAPTFPWLAKHFYEKPVVLVMDDGRRLHLFKGGTTDLRYSAELGIWRETETGRAGKVDKEDEINFDPFSMQW